jgi:hypothetical protein
MASEAQVLANRSNARKSTGPRTPEGKGVVSQNAVKHGLLAREVVIKGEDPGEFEFYRDQMLGELAPVGSVESMLAERVVSLSWRLQRAERLQGAVFDALYEKETAGPFAKLNRSLWSKRAAQGDPGGGDGDSAFGRVVVKDFSDARVLDRLLMYERRIEHSLYRTMGELQKQRLLRELNPPTEGSTAEAVSPVCRGPVWGERPFGKLRACPERQPNGAGSRSPEEVGWGRPTYEEPPHGPGSSPGQAPPAKAGVTMNAPAAPTGPLAGPCLFLNQAQSPAPQPETDSAKQSQLGTGQIGANLFPREGLHPEGQAVPPEEQSQFSAVAIAGNGFGLDTERAKRYNDALTGASCRPVCTEE